MTFACANIADPLWTRMLKRAMRVVSSATLVSRMRLLVAVRFSFNNDSWPRVTLSRWMLAPIRARMLAKFWIEVWILLNAEPALVVLVMLLVEAV